MDHRQVEELRTRLKEADELIQEIGKWKNAVGYSNNRDSLPIIIDRGGDTRITLDSNEAKEFHRLAEKGLAKREAELKNMEA